MSSSPFISLSNVSKKYSAERFAGVSDVSLVIEKGRIVSIVGESGSGKSTLLKLIYGVLSPDTGTISFKGERILGPSEKLIAGHDSMKSVTQAFDLNTYSKVYDNIAGMLPNTNLHLKQEKTEATLELLRIRHLAEKRVVDLSGGEQQRVAIARAIITEPEVLLLDEPFSQVDTLLKTQLRFDINRLSKELHITIVLVSHDPADGLSLADQIVVLKQGVVLEQGTVHDMYNKPGCVYTARLLANANVLTKVQADAIGIRAKKEFVVIYPEWIEIKNSWVGNSFRVIEKVFKGFYSELLIERNGINMRALNFEHQDFLPGKSIQATIKRYLEVDE
jgi:ABC-type Fe3+/spermidine/putrescine transport system ATPase subunit